MTHGGLRARSSKRAAQDRERRTLKRRLFDAEPWCQRCGYSTTYIDDLDLHELLSRARGGSITDEENCRLVCRPCHEDITFRAYEIDDADRWVKSRFGAAS